MQTVNFWNGNKSSVRQEHELKLVEAILQATVNEYGQQKLTDDRTDYPCAEDEGNIFYTGTDLLVTVEGNQKFNGKAFIKIDAPLAKGILGNRILIVRKNSADMFSSLTESALKKLKSGIPATWADADLFRHNGYTVIEKGLFEEIFQRLADGECDYVALGANEVESIFKQITSPEQNLCIEPDLILYYPFPLVFYVHPDKPELAKQIEHGIKQIKESGEYDVLFNEFYGSCVESLNLKNRNKFELINPNSTG